MAGARTGSRRSAVMGLFRAFRISRRPDGPSLGQHLNAVPRMARATLLGKYPALTRGKLGLMTLAAIYIVVPFDLAPEMVLSIFGVADDAVVGLWLAGTLINETDQFLTWEREKDRVVPGDVVS